MARKLKHDTDHLRMFLTIYAVFFAFGIRGIIDYVSQHGSLQLSLVAAAVILVGLRLIFTPEALSLFMLCRRQLASPKPLDPRVLVIFHYHIMILQGVMVYLAARNLSCVNVGCPESDARPYQAIVFAIIALGVNFVWLASLRLDVWRNGMDVGAVLGDPVLGNRCYPSTVWMVNNLLLGGAAWAVLVHTETTFIPAVLLLLNALIDYSITAPWYEPQVNLTA